jgi:hypothetical protein
MLFSQRYLRALEQKKTCRRDSGAGTAEALELAHRQQHPAA